MDEKATWRAALRCAGDSEKNWWVAFGLSLFLGFFGFDRFYLGSYGLGLIKLCTGGAGGVWWLIDLALLATNAMRDADGNIVRKPV